MAPLGPDVHRDPYAKTRHHVALQADEDMRRDEPWLWHYCECDDLDHPSLDQPAARNDVSMPRSRHGCYIDTYRRC
jgi:hypothetical protein